MGECQKVDYRFLFIRNMPTVYISILLLSRSFEAFFHYFYSKSGISFLSLLSIKLTFSKSLWHIYIAVGACHDHEGEF